MLDTTKLASGYRASKIIGGGAIYEANETVGTVDELLIAVTYDSLKMAANKIMLPGANKEALKALPEYRYTRSRRLLPAVKMPR